MQLDLFQAEPVHVCQGFYTYAWVPADVYLTCGCKYARRRNSILNHREAARAERAKPLPCQAS